MSEVLKAAANAAGLDSAQKSQIDALSKALAAHQKLSALPPDVAQQQFGTYTQGQQQYLQQAFGDDPNPTPKRSVLGTAAHYIKSYNPITLAFKGANEASDLMTRLYRTAVISADQGVAPFGKGNAWDIANDKGDKTFAPDRIAKAKQLFGDDRIAVAIRVASGERLSKIQATAANEAQANIAALANQNKDNLFQDALDSVQAAKYSPGRQVANAILPAGMEGSGPLYKIISGLTDAAYRVVLDPTLALGKAYRLFEVANYSLAKIAGGGSQAIEKAFSNTEVQQFWNRAGSLLGDFQKAREAKDFKTVAMARAELKRLAPELNPVIWDELAKPQIGVRSAVDMKNFMLNSSDAFDLLSGQSTRLTPLLPRMSPGRRIRLNTLTTANRVFNWKDVNTQILDDLYGEAAILVNKNTPDALLDRAVEAGVLKEENGMFIFKGGVILGDSPEAAVNFLKNDGNVRGQIEKTIDALDARKVINTIAANSTKKAVAATRFSKERVRYNVDRFLGRFNTMPFFDGEHFDVMAPDAMKKVQQLARLQLPGSVSKTVAEIFDASEEGVRKEIFTALWGSVANIRNVTKTETGRYVLNLGTSAMRRTQYAADNISVTADDGTTILTNANPSVFPDGVSRAILPTQLSSTMPAPDMNELVSMAARDGFLGRIAGLSNHDALKSLVSYWNFFTLAGPRFAVRNAIEDYMVHLAVGKNVWGVAKARAISTQLRIAREGVDTGFINRIALKSKRNEYRELHEAIRTNKKLSDVEKLQEHRALMATALQESTVGRHLKPDEWEILHDQIMHGSMDNALSAVTEGSTLGFTGMDKASRATALANQYNNQSITEIIVNGAKYKRDFSKGFTNISPGADMSSKLAWVNTIHRYNSDPVARIVLKHLDGATVDGALIGRQDAVREITEWYLRNPKELARFRAAGLNDFTVEDLAGRAYDSVWNTFSKADGRLNYDLLAKIRPNGKGTDFFTFGEFGVDDLPLDISDMPKMIFGPTYAVVGDSGNWLRSFTDAAWWSMGQANARFSREPIFIDALLQVRKEMRNTGMETRMMSMFTKGVTDPDKLRPLEKAAKEHIARLAEERALEYTLAYVDNPLVQSQLAFVGKNMARYYRATEDFYRRITRTLRYNPDAIAKAALTYEGITHSGFIETDDQGNKYFIFPGLAPVFKAVYGVFGIFGRNADFRMPMPMQFGANINMVTPSINPDSLVPTFAGPVAAVPLKALTSIVGVFSPDLSDKITKITMGQYAVDQPIMSGILPSHINRIYAALNRDERDSQYASAARKAMTYYAAAGMVPQPRINPETGMEEPPSAGEIRDFQEKLKNATLAILSMRVILGFVGPATPNAQLKSDMAKWVRDNGEQSFKTLFNNLVTETGSYEKAMEIWLTKYPNQMPYTVSESDSQVKGLMKSIKPVGDWLDQNGHVVKNYPQAASFLVPQTGPMSFDVYRTLMNEGLLKRKSLSDFYKDVTTAADLKVYYANRDSYQSQLAVTADSFSKQQIKAQWDSWAKPFLAARPEVQAELSQGGQRQVEREKALTDLRRMLADKSVTASPKARAAISEMVALYDQYKQQSALANMMPGQFGDMGDAVKAGIKQQMEAIADRNANASAAYERIFRRLIGD